MDPLATPQPSPSGRTVALIGIALLIIIVGYAAYHFHSSKQSASFLPKGTIITLSTDALPAHEAREIKNGQLALLTIPGQGTANLLAVASTSKHEYYLMSGPEAGQTTLYRLDVNHPEAGLSQLTTSKTAKTDLSVDGGDRFAAFAEYGSSSSPEIIVLNLQSGKEDSYGAGTHPVMLFQGNAIIAERAGTLVMINTRTKDVFELVPKVPDGSLFAVNSTSSQLAFYDAGANVVHTYQLNATGVSPLSSIVPGEHPGALFYVGSNLYMARMLPDTLVLSSLDATRDERMPAPGFSLDGFMINSL